jgi:phosphopantothenoylcysteine decarboxylase
MRVILGITGSVAATLTARLAGQLLDAGHEVRIIATTPALYFLPVDSVTARGLAVFGSLGAIGCKVSSVPLHTDKEEWPLGGWHKGDTIGHIDFKSWGDVLLIAPLSANTLAKLALGLADNFLSCTARAWPNAKPLVLAPAMNTDMWLDPITGQQLGQIGQRFKALTIVQPVSKVLACGDEGIGAMADIADIVAALAKL